MQIFLYLLIFYSLADIVTSHSFSYGDKRHSHKIFDCDNGPYEKKYGPITQVERLNLRDSTKEMFYFAFNNYMEHAYPLDELDPINCRGRGPDYDDPSNININDVLGDYSLSLVDSLGTIAVIGDMDLFKKSVQLVIENVTFDKDNIVQVFEANIRIIGSLLSTHLLIKDPIQPFGSLNLDWYEGELLDMAADLAARLLPAFENSRTGLPHPRVNLKNGVPINARTDTCTAGAGTLLVEFGILSRLLDDPTYELAARRAVNALWKLRNKNTGLFGNIVDVNTGEWEGELSGVGAGLDSFYEYMLKAYILFGETEDYSKFNETYGLIKQYMRRGRPKCNSGFGEHPLYVNVHMRSGLTKTTWIDSLQASFAGMQVLAGDVEEAICTHALYYAIWKKYGVLPERFNWQYIIPEIGFYPLRPEFVESTYLLYQATKNPFYLHVGREIVYSLNNLTRAQCGYATMHSVLDKTLEDRMESFFLSETCKYLYLLFDTDNPINKKSWRYLFTTEGHIIPLGSWLRSSSTDKQYFGGLSLEPATNTSNTNCKAVHEDRTFGLPLESRYLAQVSSVMGVEL